MFGDREYIEQHQDSIMAIIRSVGVCLHTLLDTNNNPNVSELLERELFNHNELYEIAESSENQDVSQRITTRDPVIIQNNFIINNISTILFDTKFNNLMDHFIENLHANNQSEEALYFAESLNIARSLPETTKNQTKEIIDYLKNSGEECFDSFFSSFVAHEDRRIQSKFIDLVLHYFQKIHNLIFEPHNTSDDSNYYATQNKQEDEEYEYLFGNIHKTKDAFEQLDQRIRFLQAFKAGVVDQQQDYVWKLKDDQGSSFEEINTLLAFSETFPSDDFNERLSLTIQNIDNPAVENFKQKLEKSKLKIC